MDGISAAASVLAVGTAGVQISIKLIAFANQVATASERVRSIGVDISLTANVLQQLGELMSKPKQNEAVSIFSEEGLATTQASTAACEEVFRDLEVVLNKANGQFRIKAAGAALGKKITLSKVEALKWLFLQPGVDSLRTTLNNARETLMLILHVTTLAYMKKLAELNYPSASSLSEQSQQVSSILALRCSQAAAVPTTAVISHNNPHSAPKDNQRAPDLPTLDSSDIRGQDCATEPLPPTTPSTHTTIRSTVDPFASRNDKPTIPIPGFSSSPRREADEALLGPLDTTGFDDEPTQSAQHDQKDPNLVNRSRNALSNDQNPNKHRQAVDDSSKLSESMQVWIIEPIISKAEDHNGYDIWWERHLLPLSPSEFKLVSRDFRDFRRSFWQKKKTISEQFADLSKYERYVLEYFLNKGKLGALPGNTSIRSVKLMKMQPAREPITQMPWRGIHVLVERTDLMVPSALKLHAHAQPQHHVVNRPYHDPGEENAHFEELVAQDHRLHPGILPPRIMETKPRARMPPHRLQRSGARGRTQSRHDWSSDSLFSENDVGDRYSPLCPADDGFGFQHAAWGVPTRSGSGFAGIDVGDRHQSGRGGHPPVCSDDDSFYSPHAKADLATVNEVPEDPTSLSEEEEMQNSGIEDETAEDPMSEELSAETSRRIIDDLLAKYTTIYS